MARFLRSVDRRRALTLSTASTTVDAEFSPEMTMPRLDIRAGEKLFLRVNLTQDTVNVGRHSWCEVQLPSQQVSRFHTRLTKDEHGDYWIENLSDFGTLLNGKKLEGRQRLEAGDSLSVGDYSVTFHPEEGPPLDEEFLPTMLPD